MGHALDLSSTMGRLDAVCAIIQCCEWASKPACSMAVIVGWHVATNAMLPTPLPNHKPSQLNHNDHALMAGTTWCPTGAPTHCLTCMIHLTGPHNLDV